MLVEAPYTTVLPTLPDIVFRLKVKGVTALIAHPERCLETQKLERARQRLLDDRGPVFRQPIPVERGEKVLREERFYYCDLISAADGVSPHA